MLILNLWDLGQVTSGILITLLASIGGLIVYGFRHRFEKPTKLEVEPKEKTTSQNDGYIAGIDNKGYKSKLDPNLRKLDNHFRKNKSSHLKDN